jgi:hypothetical protein
MLRMSRARLYNRINKGAITPEGRTYFTRIELERYVEACARKCRTRECSGRRFRQSCTEGA